MILSELATQLGVKWQGDGQLVIRGLASLATAGADQLSFLDNPRYRHYLQTTQAGAVILKPEEAEKARCSVLLSEHPYLTFAQATHCFAVPCEFVAGIHPTAQIGARAKIAPTASIGPYVVVGDDVTIGERVLIDAHSDIGQGCEIGEGTHLYPRVTLYHGVKIGARGIVHSGVVLGSDGFGFAMDKGTWVKVLQLGGVTIGKDVEIGANTTIDRGALEDTVIEDGVKLDNQIQIAHNVRIGAHTVVAGCVGIAGSTVIGRHCMIGGGSGIAGHLHITDKVVLTGMAMVTHDIKKSGVYSSGTGLLPRADWQKNTVRFRQLDTFVRSIKNKES